MSSIIVHFIAFTVLVIVVVQQMHAQPDLNAVAASTIQRTKPTVPPTCPPTPRCTLQSPPVCARNRCGMCRLFNNLCDMYDANCPKGRPVQIWSYVPESQCRNLRPNTTGCCAISCPRRPFRCPKNCRKSLNCHTTPGGSEY